VAFINIDLDALSFNNISGLRHRRLVVLGVVMTVSRLYALYWSSFHKLS